jgi:hypothetical protein
LHVAVIAGVVITAVRYVDSDQFVHAIQQFHWSYVPAVLGLSLIYLGLKAWRFAVQLRHLARASRFVVLRGYIASQAATLIPGGFAMRAAILEEAGVPAPDSAASITLSSFSDLLVLLVGALVSALWFETARKPILIALTILILVSLLLSLGAVQAGLCGGLEKMALRFGLLDGWRAFVASLKQAASDGLVFGAVGYGLLAFGCLVDVGMVGILDATPDVRLSQAAAAVAIFRVGTILFNTLVGGLVYLFAWRGKAEMATGYASHATAE